MKNILFPFLLLCLFSFSQTKKLNYEVFLFGKKIGNTVVERTDKGNGTVEFRLNSSSEANVLFTKKTSAMNLVVEYKDGKLQSSYVKNMKDGVTDITQVIWKDARYLITKGEERLQISRLIDFSSVMLYFAEPVGRAKIFSERLGDFCSFVKTDNGVYECKLANGVNNIYKYKNGVLTELEMNKGASVFLRLVP